MSISLSQRPAGNSANPTRQQLDELDALLQRMLDLPVEKNDTADDSTPREVPAPVSYTTEDADEPPADEPVPLKIDFQALKLRLAAQAEPTHDAPATVGADREPAVEEENWVPLSSTWQPSSLTWKPLARSLQQPPTADATPGKEVPVWEPVPTQMPEPAKAVTTFRELGEVRNPLVGVVDVPAGAPVARWAMPLVWVNGLFDACLAPLGRRGRFLLGRPGRLCLALVGVACLVAAAVVLFIDWIGWTS